MVGRGLAEGAPREKRAPYDDARCTSPSGQRQPQQVCEDICKSPPFVLSSRAQFCIISYHMLLSFSQSAAHGGQPIGQLTTYALAHMDPTKSNIEYNPVAGPEAYTNSSVHTRLTSYMEAARSVHGPDYDPRTEEHLDPELVMRVGEGKKHGRFWIGDDILDTGSTPPLHCLRAASTSSSVPIRQRPSSVVALQVSIPVSFVVLCHLHSLAMHY